MSKRSQSGRKPVSRPTAEAAGREPTRPSPASGAALTKEPQSERRVLRFLMGVWRSVHGFVKEAEPWGILAAVLALFLSFIALRGDLEDRMETREVQAWQLLLTKAPGNSGKREALEYLNKEHDGGLCLGGLCLLWPPKTRTPLVGIDLSLPNKTEPRGYSTVNFAPETYLREVQLPNADLSFANLEYAELYGADLTALISIAHCSTLPSYARRE